MKIKSLFWTLLLVLCTLNFASCGSDDNEGKVSVPELTDRNTIQFTADLTRWRDMEVFVKGNYGIDWGDGTVVKGSNAYATAVRHKYSEIGQYTVQVWCEDLTAFKYTLEDTKAVVSELKIGNCPKLTEMSVTNFVKTPYLDLRACHKLEKLSVENLLDLTEVDLANCAELEELTCFSNPKLTAIDVSKCTKLESLKCYDNALTMLSVSANEELLTVNVANNQIRTIDFGKVKSVTELDIQGNQLTEINLAPFEELESFNGNGNKFTFLDFSDNASLINLLCANNRLTGFIFHEEAPIHQVACNGNDLDADFLNQLFTDLPVSSVIASRSYTTPNSIAFYNNPGESACSVKIIKDKGWKVELKK